MRETPNMNTLRFDLNRNGSWLTQAGSHNRQVAETFDELIEQMTAARQSQLPFRFVSIAGLFPPLDAESLDTEA